MVTLQIIRRIAGPVLTVTLFATAVAYAWHKGHDVHLTNSVIPVVAVVVSSEHIISVYTRPNGSIGWVDLGLPVSTLGVRLQYFELMVCRNGCLSFFSLYIDNV
jgi:hypothetical protein